ncbi:unnamed protein product [Bubo scandiacus]
MSGPRLSASTSAYPSGSPPAAGAEPQSHLCWRGREGGGSPRRSPRSPAAIYDSLMFFCVKSDPAPTQGPTSAGAAGTPPATNVSSNKRMQQTQARVDEVVDIMRMNVDKVLERDQKLSELDNRADALQAGASQFETSAAKLKRKYWWKNCKMMIILGVVCAVILIIIIIYFST